MKIEVTMKTPENGIREIRVHVDGTPWHQFVMARHHGFIGQLEIPDNTLALHIEPEDVSEIENLRQRISELEVHNQA